MNPSISFPIEQSYVNLAVVETKDQQKKEKELLGTNPSEEVLGSYEEIYGRTKEIKIQNIFEECKDRKKSIFVTGRAGIGKTTFCRYIAYQWAAGAIWQEYQLTQHHILTSRPCSNLLSYNMQLEITGFVDKNIEKIWGIVHIPVNLELICSLWCDTDWSETTTLNMTTVYDKITEWLCRRYLEKQNVSTNQMTKEDVYEHCHQELAFLESLAFNGMEKRTYAMIKGNTISNPQPELIHTILIARLHFDPSLEMTASRVRGMIGGKVVTNTIVDMLMNALSNGDDSVSDTAIDALDEISETAPTIELINTLVKILHNKHHELIQDRAKQCLKHIGIITATEEVIRALVELLRDEDIGIKNCACTALAAIDLKEATEEVIAVFVELLYDEDPDIRKCACAVLKNLGEKAATDDVISVLAESLRYEDVSVRKCACAVLKNIGEKAVTDDIISALVEALHDEDPGIRKCACAFLENIGEKAPNEKVIGALLVVLQDKSLDIRYDASRALGNIAVKATSEKMLDGLLEAMKDAYSYSDRYTPLTVLEKIAKNAPTKEVIDVFVKALTIYDRQVRSRACKAIGDIGEKAATKEVIDALIVTLQDCSVTADAVKALERLGINMASKYVIDALVEALENVDIHSDPRGICKAIDYIGEKAGSKEAEVCAVLGQIGEKAATKEVINALVLALRDSESELRVAAYTALGQIAKKAATKEMISVLLEALRDTKSDIRASLCTALGQIGEKAATKERAACTALGQIGEKAATNEVINALILALRDTKSDLRESVCTTLGQIGEKVVTKEVINALVEALRDTDSC
ncbi:unnamed protein product, partial [Adineta steineri]